MQLAKPDAGSGNMEQRIVSALHDSISHMIRASIEDAVRKAHRKERARERKEDEANKDEEINGK